MLSVIDAMRASSGYRRPMRSGEELLQSGMVVSVGKKSKENDLVHVQALVLRTSGINTKHPAVVELWIDISKEYGERLIRDNEQELTKECDCPAGTSEKCKHILAVMLYLSRVEESELDDLSCTDIEQQWGSLKTATLQEYDAKPQSELCHVKRQRDVYVNTMPQVTTEMENRWRDKLRQCAPNSEYNLLTSCLRRGQGTIDCEKDPNANGNVENTSLLKGLLTFCSWHVLGVLKVMTEEKLQKCEPALIDFYNTHVVVSLDESVRMFHAKQGTNDWHHARKLRQTASKARAQYTYLLNANADWDKRYREVFHSNFIGNEDTFRGLRCEPLARAKYEEMLNCSILESGLLVRPELPWLSASLDGAVVDSNGEFIRNIEIKTLKQGTRLTAMELVEMDAIPTLDRQGNIKKKTQHYTQMQLGMLLSGMKECDYLIFSEVGNDFVLKKVLFDEDHILQICPALLIIYFDKFLTRMLAEYSDLTFNKK